MMAVPAASAAVNPVRLGMLWRDSDLPADCDVLTRACWAAVPLLDLGVIEQLAHAATGAGADIAVNA